MPASHRCGTLREVTRRKRGENQRGCIFWWAKASAMMRTQESADENSPKAMFHFSRAVRGTLRQREALRLRRRQPFQTTQSVAVARNAET